MTKKILLTVTVIICILAIIAGYYIFIFDAAKDTSYQPIVDKTNIETEIKRLNAPTKGLSTELLINSKELKAILVIGSGLDSSSDSKALTIKEIADLRSHGGYYKFPDQSVEVAICDIRYSHIKDALGYGWFSYQGNLYAKRFGREKAKGKPNYRYQVEIFIGKEESNYHILAFCNMDSIDIVLNEAVNQINKMQQ